jgi:hypothetical protein
LAITVLLILAVLWAAVLIPPVLRSRTESRRNDSLGFPLRFPRPIGLPRGPIAIGGSGRSSFRPGRFPSRTRPAQVLGSPLAAAGPTMTPTQRRRRDVLVVLLAVVAITFLIALLSGSIGFWLVQLLADALLGTYVFLLVQLKQTREQRGAGTPRTAAAVHERPRRLRYEPHGTAQRISA